MKILFTIGVGSFIGGVLRYLFSSLMQTRVDTSFPWGTMIVNLTGCFLIGLCYGLAEKNNLSSEMVMFLTTGLLGGFTTFSAFSNETISMFRDGQMFSALIYVAISVVVGLSLTFLGLQSVKLF